MNAVNLSDWLKGIFTDDWQSLEDLGIDPNAEAAFYRLKPGRIVDLGMTLGSQEVTLEARLSEGDLKISITPPIAYEVELSDRDGTKSYLVTLVWNDIRHQISFTVEP